MHGQISPPRTSHTRLRAMSALCFSSFHPNWRVPARRLGGQVECDDICPTWNIGPIRPRVMKRAPVVYRAATGTQRASHGFRTIEIAATFQRVRVGIVICGAVYEDVATIRSGNKLHAAVFHAHVLKGHPDTKFPIDVIWLRAISLVLVPRRGRTAPSGL